MNEKLAIEKEIIHQGILPLFYHNDAATCIFITKALYAAGIRSIEFTNRGTQALQNFSLLIHEKNSTMPDLLVGIGTIKNEEEANTFMNAGADFLVSPFFEGTVCKAALLKKKLWIPGCITPTEINIAAQAPDRNVFSAKS